MSEFVCLEKVTCNFNDEEIEKTVYSTRVELDKFVHHSGWWVLFETIGRKQYQSGVEQYIIWRVVAESFRTAVADGSSQLMRIANND